VPLAIPKPMGRYDARRLELLAVIMVLEEFKFYIYRWCESVPRHRSAGIR
jgi:hypothetical protein